MSLPIDPAADAGYADRDGGAAQNRPDGRPDLPRTDDAFPTAGLPAVGDFTRLALWMAGSLAGVETATHAAQTKRFRRLARRVGWAAPGRRPNREAGMALLSDAVVGTSSDAVSSVFGRPTAEAGGRAEPRTGVGRRSPERSRPVPPVGAWLYPLAGTAGGAVAIEFTDGVASRTVFVRVDHG